MRGFFRLTRTSLDHTIARHKTSRAIRLKLESCPPATWSIFVYPLACFARRMETRALGRLASACPEGAEAAKRKSLYLIALVVADRTSPSMTCLEKAISTLRPYRATLGDYLRQPKGSSHLTE